MSVFGPGSGATTAPRTTAPCPCGTGRPLAGCCGPLLAGTAQAQTPEQLMRSRYTAYALGDLDHVWRTWHPRTRPATVEPDPGLTWTRLQVVDAVGDEVEFVAHHERDGRAGTLHERSRFARRAGRWFYLEASSATTSA